MVKKIAVTNKWGIELVAQERRHGYYYMTDDTRDGRARAEKWMKRHDSAGTCEIVEIEVER